MSTSCLTLLSGGLDSSVASFVARQDRVLSLAVVFDYGQHAVSREIRAAKTMARELKVPLKIIRLPFLAEVTRTALVMNEQLIPQIKMTQLDDRSEARKSAAGVWVPNRNGLFLNIAASLAEGEGLSSIVVGFNAEEAATFPDNSANFIDRAERLFEFSTLGKIKIFAPLLGFNKTEIVREGLRRQVPFEEVWSCYLGRRKMCGRCESCLRSMRAYQSAGLWQRLASRFEV